MQDLHESHEYQHGLSVGFCPIFSCFLLQPTRAADSLGVPTLVAPHSARSRINVAALRDISCEPPKQNRKTPACRSKSTACKQCVTRNRYLQ